MACGLEDRLTWQCSKDFSLWLVLREENTDISRIQIDRMAKHVYYTDFDI